MNATATFICRLYTGDDSDYSTHMRRVHPWAWECKCPQTVECEWQGDERGVALAPCALVYRDDESRGSYRSVIGKVIECGGLRLRVLDFGVEAGLAYDQFYVTLTDNPHGNLQALYRPAARAFLRFVVNLEARVRGFMLQPVEGREMPAASWLAKRLL